MALKGPAESSESGIEAGDSSVRKCKLSPPSLYRVNRANFPTLLLDHAIEQLNYGIVLKEFV